MIDHIDHIVLTTRDREGCVRFYTQVLGMALESFQTPSETRWALKFGNQKINVRPRGADKVEWFTADHVAAGSDDLCFLTASTPDEVVAHLKANGVAIEEGPVAKQGARGTLRSVYCRDPDGSLIEISSYEDRVG